MKAVNGNTNYLETFFEICQAITIEMLKTEPQGVINERHEAQGTGGLYELCEEWTNDFEQKFEGEDWADKEWWEEIEEFLDDKNFGKKD